MNYEIQATIWLLGILGWVFAPITQWQSSDLLNRLFQVQVLVGACPLIFKTYANSGRLF